MYLKHEIQVEALVRNLPGFARLRVFEGWIAALLRACGDPVTGLGDVRRRILVFLGDRAFRTEDGVDALPVREFLDELEAGRI